MLFIHKSISLKWDILTLFRLFGNSEHISGHYTMFDSPTCVYVISVFILYFLYNIVVILVFVYLFLSLLYTFIYYQKCTNIYHKCNKDTQEIRQTYADNTTNYIETTETVHQKCTEEGHTNTANTYISVL